MSIYLRSFKRIFIYLILYFILTTTNAIAGSNGAVSALSVSTSNLGAFVGYASGAVALCVRGSPCQVYSGTPNSEVTALDTDKLGSSVRVWVGYKNGDVYFCVTGECNLVTEALGEPGQSKYIKVPRPVYLKQPNENKQE